MLWVGGGALHAAAEILALAERIGAPVVSFRSGKGIVDDAPSAVAEHVAGFQLWADTDLLVGIGTRLDVPMARWAPTPAGLKIARIDIDPAEMRRLKVDVAIVADAADAAAGADRGCRAAQRPARGAGDRAREGGGAGADPEGAAADVDARGDPRRAAGRRHPRATR